VILLILNIASLGTIWIKAWDDVRPGFKKTRIPTARDHFLKRELNFTAAQQEEFDTLMNMHRIELESKIEEIRILREELMSMMKNQEFSEVSEGLVRAIGEKQSELELLNYNHFKDVLAICDEDQKQVFLETLKRAVGPHHRDRGPASDEGRRRGMRGK